MQQFKVINGALTELPEDSQLLGFADPVEAVACHIIAELAVLASKHRRLVEQSELNFPGLFRAADVDTRISQMTGGNRAV